MRIRFAENNWRPDAATLVSTGDYRIPEDMTQELADRAIAEGAAVLIVEEQAPPPKAGAKQTTKPQE